MAIGDGTSRPGHQQTTPSVQALGRVMLKFRDSIDLPYRDGVEDELEPRGIGPWRELATQFPGLRLRRLYSSMDPDRLRELTNRAREHDSTYRPPNFFSYFVVDCSPGIKADDVAAALQRWPSVEYAYPAPEVELPAFVTSDPRLQGFQSPAQDGIDAFYAWNIVGGDGAGQTIVDMEPGWTLDHEDLNLLGKAPILNNVQSSAIYATHGTCVLGIIHALDNGNQCVGIAPNATVKLVSNADPITLLPDSTRIPDAIATALLSLNAGNVLLLEAQIAGQVLGVPKYLPCEADDACYAAIRLASALDVVVIEPAGTNDVDLDAFVDGAGLHVLDTGVRGEFRDSGAIVVGGATSALPHTHLAAVSAHGSRIDCYGWAENVTTCDSNSSGSTTLYTNSFGGTSGASAIVAGVVLLIQGMLEKSGSPRFSAAQMRAILRDTANGTEVTPIGGGVPTRAIPDLRKIAQGVLKVAPDIYVRDYLGDTGAADGVSQAMSPDIIVRNVDVGDSQIAFGTGSGTEEDDALSNSVLAGQDNFVYVRVRNRGGSDAANVTVTAYWAEPSTLITPDVWTPIGSAVIGNVPADGSLSVSPAIKWSAGNIPGPGHFCVVALASQALDPAPVWANFSAMTNVNAWDAFTAFINRNNNVAWRNFEVVSLALNASSAPLMRQFWMRGAFDRARPMVLEVAAKLSPGASIAFDAPIQMFELWGHRSFDHTEKGRARIPIVGDRPLVLPAVALPAKAKVPLRIHVAIPDGAHEISGEVYARQLYEGIELGRVTWRFQRQLPNVTDTGHRERTGRQR